MLFRLAELEEIVEVAFYSSMVEKAVPISLLLVGPSGTAKSALIKQYTSEHIFPSDSFTSQGLWEMAQGDTKEQIRFMTVPDVNPTLSRKSSVVQSTIGNLLTLTYDGSVRINDGRREKLCQHDPIGFLSGVTPEIYRTHAKRWLWLGLRRRIIPLFFTYSTETVSELQELTRTGKIHSALDGRKPVSFPEKKFSVTIPQKEALLIQAESAVFSICLGKVSLWDSRTKQQRWWQSEVVPISPHLTLRALAQAKARRDKRGSVTEEEIRFLRRFISYADPEKPRTI